MYSLILVSLVIGFVECHSSSYYSVPHPKIEVFRPTGFRISIPDYPGIHMFSISTKTNTPLQYHDVGGFIENITNKKNGRWTYENKFTRLQEGDVIYYWMFVLKDRLGYIRENEYFIVNEIRNAPPGFYDEYITEPSHPSTTHKTYAQVSTTESPRDCICNNENSNQLASTQNSNIPYLINTVINTTHRNQYLEKEVSTLQIAYEFMLQKLNSIQKENTNLLSLGGFVRLRENPYIFISTFLKDKLKIHNVHITSARWNVDDTLTFETKSYEEKLRVYTTAIEKLKNSTFVVRDA